MLDSGATRSFISPQAVQALSSELVPFETIPLHVTLPNGDSIKTKAAYTLKIYIEDIEFEVILFEVKMQQHIIFGADFC